MKISYQPVCILIFSTDPIMSFIFFSPYSTGICPGSGVIFRCHVSLVSFSLEYFHSLFLTFMRLTFLKDLLSLLPTTPPHLPLLVELSLL